MPLLLVAFFTTQAQTQVNLSEPLSKTDTLKVMSWNIYMLPPLLKFTGKKKRAEAIADTVAKMDYDIIVFEEAFHKGARKRIERKIQEAYPYRLGPAFPKKISIKTSDGIWIVSKFPIQEIDKIRFIERAGIDKMARKGALMIKMEKNEQPFYIIGTHLDDAGTLDIRISQLKQVKSELIDRYSKDSIPIILAGDLNISKYDLIGMDSMLNILNVKDYEISGHRKLSYDYTSNSLAYGNYQGTLDHIFLFPKNINVVKTRFSIPLFEKRWSKKEKTLSDHYPIEMILHYQKK